VVIIYLDVWATCFLANQKNTEHSQIPWKFLEHPQHSLIPSWKAGRDVAAQAPPRLRAMSDKTRDDPQASLMSRAADSETAASRRPPASSVRRARGDVRDTFLRRGSTPGQARAPSDQKVLCELEELRRELYGLSSSGPTPRAKSPPASIDTKDKWGVMCKHRSDPLMSDEAWEDTKTSLMAGAAVVRGTLGRSTQTLPRSLSDPEVTVTALHRAASHRRATSAASSAQVRGDAGRDSFPRRGSKTGPARVPRDQRAMHDLEEGSPRSAHARFDDGFKLTLSRRSGTAIPDIAHENRPRRHAHPLRSVDEAAGGPLTGGVGTGQRYSYSESSPDACEAAQRRQKAQVCYESKQSDQPTLRQNQYLAAQQLNAARRKLEVSTLAWEHAKESFQLAKENVRRRSANLNADADADADADKDTTADMDTGTDSPSTSTQRARERLTQRIKWLCLLLSLVLCGLLTFWMYVPRLSPPLSGEDTN
jgi:hypothetical protein